MTTENLFATAVLDTATLLTPNNCLGAPDGVYTTNVDQSPWSTRLEMGNPVGNQANGSHTVTLRVRKDAGTGTPTISTVSLFDSATGLTIGARSVAASITSTTGQDVVATFTQAEMRALSSLANANIDIVTTAIGGGGSARTCVQLDAVTWSGDFTTVAGPPPDTDNFFQFL